MPIFKKNPLIDNELPTYRQGKLLPVLRARELLGSRGHQELLEKLREYADMPDEHYEALYQVFLDQFAEFVQVMPTKIDGALCGLLNQGLTRGINALHLLIDTYDDLEPIERYAVFTAGVLMDVAKALTNQSVFITEPDGCYIETWEPARGSLHDQEASWYKIFPFKTNYSRLRDPLTVLLARQILPDEGYEWIAGHWSIYVDWLDALCATGLKGGRISHILDIIRHEDPFLLWETLPEIEVDIKDGEETVLADEFFVWLEQEFERDELKTEGADPDLYIFEDGVLVDARVIDRYSKYYNCPNTVVFYQIGNCLGIAKQSGDDFRFDQFFKQSGGAGLMMSSKSTTKGLYLSRQFTGAKGRIQENLQLQGKSREKGLPALGGKLQSGSNPLATRPGRRRK